MSELQQQIATALEQYKKVELELADGRRVHSSEIEKSNKWHYGRIAEATAATSKAEAETKKAQKAVEQERNEHARTMEKSEHCERSWMLNPVRSRETGSRGIS